VSSADPVNDTATSRCRVEARRIRQELADDRSASFTAAKYWRERLVE
jgi:hypothetical protein